MSETKDTNPRPSNCHPERKHKAKGLCAPCYKRARMAADPAARQKAIEYARKWQREHPGRRRAHKSSEMDRYRADPARRNRMRNWRLRREYGITLVQRDQMEIAQGSVCCLCLRTPNGKRGLNVDHCHKTGRIRGLLCSPCNSYMGFVDADPTIIDRLGRYGGTHAP